MTAFQVRLPHFLSALALATALATPFVATHAQGFSSVSSGTSRAAVTPPQGALVDATSVPNSRPPRVDTPPAQVAVAADNVPILASAVPVTPAFGGTQAAAAPAMPSQPASAGSGSPAMPAPAAPVPAPVASVGTASTTASSTGSGGFSSVSGGAPSLPSRPVAGANYGAGSSSAFEMAEKVIVIKHERVLRLLRRGRVIAEYPIKLGLNPYGHKQREGDFRTPEGNYELVFRNPKSEFFLSIKISYPNREDAAVAHESGHAPGGLIMIHGQPNEPKRSPEHYATRDWTDGCIALSNADMVDVWLRTTTGIPIEIRK
jgi:L,D-transpeptidase catalytic domain